MLYISIGIVLLILTTPQIRSGITLWFYLLYLMDNVIKHFVLWWRVRPNLCLIFVSHLFKNLFFNWRITALQNFVGFCQTSTWIRSHKGSHSGVFYEYYINVPNFCGLKMLITSSKNSKNINNYKLYCLFAYLLKVFIS